MNAWRRLMLLMLSLIALGSVLIVGAGAASGTCSNGLTWTLDEASGMLSFGRESNAIPNFTNTSYIPWYGYRSQIRTVDLSQISTVRNDAFYGCTALEKVIRSETSMQKIGSLAFYNCSGLKSIACSSTGTEIAADAFNGCSKLEWIYLPFGTTVERNAFYGCGALKTVYYSGTASDWDTYVAVSTGNSKLTQAARSYCQEFHMTADSVLVLDHDGLLTLSGEGIFDAFPSGFYAISAGAVKRVLIGNGITGFRSDAPFSGFVGCEVYSVEDGSRTYQSEEGILLEQSTLTLLVYPSAKTDSVYYVPPGVEAIAAEAFASCAALNEVHFSGKAPAISEYSFYGDNLTIYYPADASGWDAVIRQSYVNASLTWKTGTGHPAGHDGLSFRPWKGESTTLRDGSYYLAADVALSSALTIKGTVNLCLNGNVLRYANAATSSVIFVEPDATLNIYDCDDTTGHRFHVNSNGRWALDEARGTKTVNGGCITGGTGYSGLSSNPGGGIYVGEGGSLHMYGGAVVGNSARSGAGIYLAGYYYSDTTYTKAKGILESSVQICGNAGLYGGGVYACVSELTVNGAQIYENTAYDGGGIAAMGPFTNLIINGGRICDNTANGWSGGGIHAEGQCEITLSDCTITGNRGAHGGGIYAGRTVVHVYLSGDCQLRDNKELSGATPNNAYLPEEQCLYIKEEGLADTARIGITKSDTDRAVVTSGNKGLYTDRFFSDSSDCHIAENSDGEVIRQPHLFESGTPTKAPTCTETGTAPRSCSVCGARSAVNAVLPTRGHTEVSANNAVAADCTASGKHADTVCSVCGVTLTEGEPIPAQGHTEGESAVICETPSTIDAGGAVIAGSRVTRIACAVCGAEVRQEETETYVASVASGGDGVTWTLYENGTLVLRGSGAMEDYASAEEVPWAAYRTAEDDEAVSIGTVILAEGVASVGQGAFAGCSELQAVVLGASVERIGAAAFSDCTALQRISFLGNAPENLASPNGMLSNCGIPVPKAGVRWRLHILHGAFVRRGSIWAQDRPVPMWRRPIPRTAFGAAASAPYAAISMRRMPFIRAICLRYSIRSQRIR